MEINFFETLSKYLDSPKALERKKGYESLVHIASGYEMMCNYLNNKKHPTYTWNYVFTLAHRFFIKEASDLADKKVTKQSKYPIQLIMNIVRAANQTELNITASIIISAVVRVFEVNYLRSNYGDAYLTVLEKHLLQKTQYCGEITTLEWQNLFVAIKNECEKSMQNFTSEELVNALNLMIKWGHKYAFPGIILRDEFPLMTNICNTLRPNSTRMLQENVLKLLLNFTNQLSKDCHSACCKLGEDTAETLLKLCNNPGLDENSKERIFKIFLLQMHIHHPQGATQHQITSYAHSWINWNTYLKYLYQLVLSEINDGMSRVGRVNMFGPKGPKQLNPSLTALAVEVFKQIFQTGTHDITQYDVNDLESSQQPSKRAKVVTGIKVILQNIQKQNCWSWVQVLVELCKKYPEIVTVKDFKSALQILSEKQIKCEDADTSYHVYRCLTVLVTVELQLDYVAEDLNSIKTLWVLVWESSIRACGLNHNEKETHQLIQTLIKYNNNITLTTLFNTYLSCVVNISEHSMETLHTLCSHYTISEKTLSDDASNRIKLINWILGVQTKRIINPDVYSNGVVAHVLVGLLLKKWPCQEKNNDETSQSVHDERSIDTIKDISNTDDNENIDYATIEYLYMHTLYERGLLTAKKTPETDENVQVHLFFQDLYKQFLMKIKNACSSAQLSEPVNVQILEKVLSYSILMGNLLAKFLEFKLFSKSELADLHLSNQFKQLLQSVTTVLQLYLTKMKNYEVVKFVTYLRQLELLFSIKFSEDVWDVVIEWIPVDLLKTLFECLNDEDGKRPEEMKYRISYAISKFCAIPVKSTLSTVQLRAITALTAPKFDPTNKVDFTNIFIFLSSIKSYKIGILPDDILKNILECLQLLHGAQTKNYKCSVHILQTLYFIFPHINASTSDRLQQRSMEFLYSFMVARKSYGPEIINCILDCLGQLAKLDSNRKWTQFSNGEFASNSIPSFLNDDYQEVRFSAISNLVNIFLIPSMDSRINFEYQTNIFESACSKIVDLFVITGQNEFSVERRTDEIVTRTASALHLYAAIIATNSTWRQRALFELIHFVTEKKLSFESTKKILRIVANNLDIPNDLVFLNMNIYYVISRWHWAKYPMEMFPYTLFECDTDIEFYVLNIKIVITLILRENNVNLLNKICEFIGTPKKEIMESVYSKVIATHLPSLLSESSSSITEKDKNEYKKMYEIYENILGAERINELLLPNIDELIVNVLQLVCDNEHFENQFGIAYMLPESDQPVLKVTECRRTLSELKEHLPNKSLLEYLFDDGVHKLQSILVLLTTAIQTTLVLNEKIKYLHQYTIFIDYIKDHIKTHNEMQDYVIRHIVMSLLHTISNKSNECTVLSTVACKYLDTFVLDVTAACLKSMERLLHNVINTLVPIAKTDTALSNECVKLLNNLIVKHPALIRNSIKDLDPFPSDTKFLPMSDTYRTISNEVFTSFTLEAEIKHFLRAGKVSMNATSRAEGLKHLHAQLTNKTEELKHLYEDLKQMADFSENCATSILHQLICMLAELALSEDQTVSIEATRCLGVLGPADLTTMVLKGETDKYIKCNSLELLIGKVVGMLSDYLVDPRIEVIGAASTALYAILNVKDGQNVFSSNIDYNCKTIEKKYLIPFFKKDARMKYQSKMNINFSLFKANVDNLNVWLPDSGVYETWIVQLTCAFLTTFSPNCYLQSLEAMCHAKVSFAKKLLPLILNLFLNLKNDITNIIKEKMNCFFNRHWTLVTSGTKEDSNEIVLNKKALKTMLSAVHLIRIQNQELDNFDLNYLHVAQAAQYCSAHFTAIMFAELWCQEKLVNINNEDYTLLFKNSTSIINYICNNETPNVFCSLQSILRDGFTKIGDADAIHGCGTSYLLHPNMSMGYCKEINKTFFASNKKRIVETVSVVSDMDNKLKQASVYFDSLINADISDNFECMKRLSEWDFSENYLNENCSSLNDFEKYKLLALKSLVDNDDQRFYEATSNARNLVIRALNHVGLHTSNNLYEILAQFKSLVEMEEFKNAKQNNAIGVVIKKWNLQDEIGCNNFSYIEPIVAQRVILLDDFIWKENLELKELLFEMQLKFVDLATVEGHDNIAKRIIANISQLTNIDRKILNRIQFTTSKLVWKINKSFGREILNKLLIDETEEDYDPFLSFETLMLYGKWMYEMKSENTQAITKNYFNKALKIWSKFERNHKANMQVYDAYYTLANFMDAEYQQLVNYIKSSVFENKVANMEKSIETAANLKLEIKGKTAIDKQRDTIRAIKYHENQSAIDKCEIENTHKEKNYYLRMAMSYYLQNLQHCDRYDLIVFRVFSLWLDNKSNTDVVNLLNESLSSIPTFKLIPLLPQIIPHIGSDDKVFAKQINLLLENCSKDHPHHALPLLLTLNYSHKDREYNPTCKNNSPTESRNVAANLLIKKLKKHSLLPLINNLELLWEALIQLAYYDNDQNNIARHLKILNIKDLDNVSLITVPIRVRMDKNYSNVIGIHKYQKKYHVPGGINKPKRISCVGSDGITRLQLVKGNDDLHQDAVMQQVFTIMNTFFKKDRHTEKLSVRTYKVIPLSQRSGILEWCENTRVIGDYLIGNGCSDSHGAHQKYRPNDVLPRKCRTELRNVASKSSDEKLKVFNKICSQIHPVFHKYFQEMFPQPTVWYERRRAYTTSVATSSMVGYILGLGDRHLTNILIDNSTAEVIHIDFGIAFEQGLVLPTPEAVPFRLTRDIVDGMGISGVEGIFRSACEKTMHVLRDNALTIVTLLEVLLYDPLFVWTITPAQAYSRQVLHESEENRPQFHESESTVTNATAERALSRVRQKLYGTEDGKTNVSVEGQVEILVQCARDPAKLCRMFQGWQAYL